MKHPWTAATAAAIGADWLEEQLAPAGDFGRRAREREGAFAPGQEREAAARISQVARVAREVDAETLAAIHDAVAACPDPSAALARAGARGVLSDAELFDMLRFVEAVARVRGLATHPEFERLGVPGWPEELAASLRTGRTAERGFYLADTYDAELAQSRVEAQQARVRYDSERSRLAERVAAYAGLDYVRDGEFVLMRDRMSGALPSEVRVLREAPTYLLCEVALDAAALTALDRLSTAEATVAEREDAVRVLLSTVVAEAAAELNAAVQTLGELDLFVGRARFAQRYDTCVPELSATPVLIFADARFLPLVESLARRGHRYVPVSLELDGAAVLTGPNMGGKTAALRTCGLLAACTAMGVPVPAASARVALFDEIAWIGVGGEAPQMSLLSAFGREVAELQEFFSRERTRPLVLIDEFARTTSPREGRALLIALIERLRSGGATALVATHLTRIAEDAAAVHLAVAGLRELPARRGEVLDLDAALERIAQVMDYRVRRVEADSEMRADAIALADVLGLDEALIARARAAL